MSKYFLHKSMQEEDMPLEKAIICLNLASITKSWISNGVILRIYLSFGIPTSQKRFEHFSISQVMNEFRLIWETLRNVKMSCTCSGELHESFSHHSCL